MNFNQIVEEIKKEEERLTLKEIQMREKLYSIFIVKDLAGNSFIEVSESAKI